MRSFQSKRISFFFFGGHVLCMIVFRRNTKRYKSLPIKKSTRKTQSANTPLDGITFSFSEQLSLRKISTASTTSYYTAFDCEVDDRQSDSSRESDNSLYQIPCVPKAFMDTSVHSEDLNYLCAGRESDQISLSSTASSCGYSRRPDSGGVPLYIPMTRGGHSPSSNSKVSVSFFIVFFLLGR